jgi:sensor domain CHASE-containing protein
MKLRPKTLLIVGLTLGVVFVVLYAALSRIMRRSFGAVEEQDVQRNVHRALEALQSDLNTLDFTLNDWAPWDDTYNFVETHSPDYIESNLDESTFTNLGINFIVYFDSAGELVYQMAVDLESGEEIPFPASLTRHFADHPLLFQHDSPDSSHKGIILLPEGPVLLASRPILPSTGEGEIHGAMIMARFLDEAEVASIAQRIRQDTAIFTLDDPSQPADVQQQLSTLLASDAAEDAITVHPQSETQVAGYTVLRDLYDDPALALRVEMPREVYAQGQQSLRLLMLALLIVGAVTIVLTLLLLERLVLIRLVKLSEGVAEIGASGDLSRRLSLPGQDELAMLAGAINKMLQDLQDALARVKVLRQEVQQLRIEIDQIKAQKQVAEITDSEYFQRLQQQAKDARSRPRKGD